MISQDRKEKTHIVNIDSDPENADWLRIARAERIARQVTGGEQMWAAAIQKADGNRSAALVHFFGFLEDAGIEIP